MFNAAFNAREFDSTSGFTTDDWHHVNPFGGRTRGRAAVLKELREVHGTFLEDVTDTVEEMDVRFALTEVAVATVTSRISDALWQAVVPWVGTRVLRLTEPITVDIAGRSDSTFAYVQLLCFALLAIAVTVVWSISDRQRPNDARLHHYLRVGVRYASASWMLLYAGVKIIKSQFPFPDLEQLLMPYGRSGPFTLLWTMMGYSIPYTWIAVSAGSVNSRAVDQRAAGVMAGHTDPRAADAGGALLLYDGSCGFCARSVQFVLRHEGRRRMLRFASLQGPYGSEVRARHPEFEGVDSIIWYDPLGRDRTDRVLARSDAVLEVLQYLGGGWRVLAVLGRAVPRAFRDAAYDLVARHRRRLASNDVCVVPTPEQRERFPELATAPLRPRPDLR